MMYASQWGISCVYPHNKFKTDLADSEKKDGMLQQFLFFVGRKETLCHCRIALGSNLKSPLLERDDGVLKVHICFSSNHY